MKELNESKCFEILSLDNILINISNIASRNKSLNVNLLGVIKFRMQKVIKINYVRSRKLQKPIRAIRFLVKYILRFQNRSFVSGNETSFPNCYSNLDLKICFKHAKTIQFRSLVFGIKISFSQLKALFQISIPIEIWSFISRTEASFPESKLLFQSGNLIYNLLNNSNSRFVSNFLLQLRFEASNFFRIRSFELSSLPESKLRFRLEYRSFAFNLWKIQMRSFASNLLLQLILKFRFQNQSFASRIEASFQESEFNFRNRTFFSAIKERMEASNLSRNNTGWKGKFKTDLF